MVVHPSLLNDRRTTARAMRALHLLVEDASARKALYAELDDELKRTVPIVVNDPTDAELRLRAYLTHKLK
jgi:hypothetical protein